MEEQINSTDEAEAELDAAWNVWGRTEPGHHDVTLASQEFGTTALYTIARALIEIAHQGREKDQGQDLADEHERQLDSNSLFIRQDPSPEIQSLLDFTDIVALIGEHVDLKLSGASWRGPCPFHGGKHRHFEVIPRQQMYYCYVCHEGGNAGTFLMKQLKLSQSEVLQKLRERRDGITEMEPTDA